MRSIKYFIHERYIDTSGVFIDDLLIVDLYVRRLYLFRCLGKANYLKYECINTYIRITPDDSVVICHKYSSYTKSIRLKGGKLLNVEYGF